MTEETSRRDVMKGAAVAGLATATIGAATGAEAAAAAAPLTDPHELYAKPPFPAQSQPWPALQSKMTPVPDCGEKSYKGSGRLAGRKALLTGADSGIGRAAAIAYAREGADIAINYYPTEEPDAQDVAKIVRAAGRKCILLPGDIRDEAFATALPGRAAQALGGLDILVSNAAYQQAKESILDISSAQFEQTMKTNIYAMFWITKAAVPLLKPGSAIVCTTSVNAFTPVKTILDYAMTKGAILIFIKGLAKQLATQGIRVNGIAPGPVWTPLQVAGGQLPEGLPKFGADTPYGRPGEPRELAGLYVTLAEAGNSFTSGSIIGANGATGES